MRDPQAIHVDQLVITPNGPAVIRARRCAAGIWTYLALDWWWRESQLTVPEPRRDPIGPVWVPMSSRCENGSHGLCKGRCADEHGVSMRCGCDRHDEDKSAGQAYNRDTSEGPRIAAETPLTNKTVRGL